MTTSRNGTWRRTWWRNSQYWARPFASIGAWDGDPKTAMTTRWPCATRPAERLRYVPTSFVGFVIPRCQGMVTRTDPTPSSRYFASTPFGRPSHFTRSSSTPTTNGVDGALAGALGGRLGWADAARVDRTSAAASTARRTPVLTAARTLMRTATEVNESKAGGAWTKVQGGGFEPPKAEPAGLQPAPFGHSGTPARAGHCSRAPARH